EPSATSTKNEEHGTWIGTMIAAHGGIVLPSDSEVAQAVAAHSPESIIPIDATNSVIPMFGTAPDAKIYALKTFSASGGGTPSSVVLAAMDRALTLKTNFNAGLPSEPVSGDGTEDLPFVYDSLDIQVVNMSLGGPTLFAGLEIDDLMTEKMLAAGIVVVTSAGNEGYAAMTGASPGTGLGSIAVGASNPPKHERILRDLQNGPGTGINFRPTNHIQMASFSSRGPTADGRPGVDIVANGFASFVQGADGHTAMVSGTSLSAPTITGAAALLRSAYPDASADDIRVALLEGANPSVIGGRPSLNDQGHGFIDIGASLTLLQNGQVDNHLPTQTYAENNTPIREILSQNGYPVLGFNRNQTHEARLTLGPGEVKQFFINIDPDVHDVVININNILSDLPTDRQNIIFGDDLMATFIDAPTSIDHTRFREFLSKDTTLNVAHPQPGVARLAFMGDWTNVGSISADINISVNKQELMPPIASGSLIDEQVDKYTFTVTAEMTQLVLGLAWTADWSFYPAHDLDLIITSPADETILDGATLDAPEEVVLDNPIPGEWTIVVEGFQLHDMRDEYILRGQDQSGNNIAVTPAAPAVTPP
ncbi:MAG: S8 family serine peptidase, partial [Gammaproteobacteria bacterium]|nr:S8 family serine peptidase [Gammaproteobacteria bacterium]